jgi:hypothetical protein
MAEKDIYNTILCTNDPRGRFFDGYIDGTPKPGTVMQIKAATAKVGGRWTWEVYNRDADGDNPQGPIVVLLEDHLQGKGVGDAYVSGTLGRLYVPLPGDELLMLLGDVSGTGDDHTIGEILMVDDGTGKLVVTTGSPENEHFVCLEAVTDPTADTLALVMRA